MRKVEINMYRLNYRTNDIIKSKFFDNIEEAYWMDAADFSSPANNIYLRYNKEV